MYQSKHNHIQELLLYKKMKVIILIFLLITIQKKPINAEQKEKTIMIIKTKYKINTYNIHLK